MAQEAEQVEEEIIDEVEEPIDEVEGEDDAAQDETSEANDNDEDDDEVVVSFGEVEEPEDDKPAPEWVKNLRKQDREKAKLIKELEAKLAEKEPAKLTPEPQLADFDYDEDAYKAAYAQYLTEKQDVDRKAQEAQARREAQEQEFIERQQSYVEAAQSLKVPNYQDAEDLVRDVLTDDQRQLIIEGIDNPQDQAYLVYALGKNPEKLQELAKITSLPRFAVELGKIQKDMKVTKRKPNSKPEQKPQGGSATAPGRLQKKLDAARADAKKSGNWDQYFALKRQAAE